MRTPLLIGLAAALVAACSTAPPAAAPDAGGEDGAAGVTAADTLDGAADGDALDAGGDDDGADAAAAAPEVDAGRADAQAAPADGAMGGDAAGLPDVVELSDVPEGATGDATPGCPPEVGPDAVPDAAPDEGPDAALDVGPDVAEDVGVDTGPEPAVIDCAGIPAGPFELSVVPGAIASEDLTFDAEGHLVGANDKALFKSAYGESPELFALPTEFHAGVRYLPDGDLVYADNNKGLIVRVTPEGVQVPLAWGFTWPNGIAVHPDGWIAFTDMQEDRVYRLDPDSGDVDVLAEVYFPNGIAWGPLFDRLYVGTSAETHAVFVMRVGPAGEVGPLVEWTAGLGGPGSLLDGLGVDVCGNVYAADFDGEGLYRISPSGSHQAKIVDSKPLPGTHLLPVIQWGTGLGGWDALHGFLPDTSTKEVFEVDLGVPGRPKPYPDVSQAPLPILPAGDPTGSCCSAHDGAGCGDAEVAACVCAGDPYCCAYGWDPLCVLEADAACGGGCAGCGDGVCSDLEGCEGCPADCGGCELDCCGPGTGPGCNDPHCEGPVCAADDFCCETAWDEICADIAADLCQACQPQCGDGLCESGESCESCAADCGQCCAGATGGCHHANDTPGCDVEWCCAKVCDASVACCQGPWDESCAEAAGTHCQTKLDCPGGGGSCWSSNGSIGCDDVGCCIVVCEEDPFCCETVWDGICGDLAGDLCEPVCGDGACGGGETCTSCVDDCGVCPTGCPGAGGACLAAHDGAGCANVACCEAVCELEPACCELAWSSGCAHEAQDLCPPQTDLCPNQGGGCFVDDGTPGCDDLDCCLTVCGADDFCCETAWDDLCVDLALELCTD